MISQWQEKLPVSSTLCSPAERHDQRPTDSETAAKLSAILGCAEAFFCCLYSSQPQPRIGVRRRRCFSDACQDRTRFFPPALDVDICPGNVLTVHLVELGPGVQ
uniref:Uncharacterized protein n=1 Tax=Octactis speculum TaxID=3111310 RepID=A0A7S2GRG1_9STRA|mmetsp:Transcript_54002/g.73780  ORF Transcript_54002/g.73780 Transcript_54002/m.73780 type:complete len:104 (+) Transcript_54002:129-440(+)